MRTRHLAIGLCTMGTTLMAWSLPAHAKAVDKTGQATIVAAPSSLVQGSFEDDTAVRIMDEGSATLANPLGIWSVDAAGTLTGGSRPKGECVESHMLHTDHVGSAGTTALTGTVTFTQPVLGVEPINSPSSATLASALDSTDPMFGVAGTVYPTGMGAVRGAEITAGDKLVLTGPNTVQFNFTTDDFDEVRVVTKCEQNPVVPEVPTVVLLPLSAAALLTVVVRRGRRSNPLAA